MNIYSRIAFHVVLCTIACTAVPVLTWGLDLDPRLMAMIWGAAGLCLLVFQLIDTWEVTTLLAKVLVVALVLSMLLTLVAQIQLRNNEVLVTVVTYPIIAHRVGCVLIGLYWRWMLRFDIEQRRHRLVSDGTDGLEPLGGPTQG